MKKRLEIGYNFPLTVREDHYFCNGLEAFSIMYLSDFHFNAFNGALVLKIIDMIQYHNPTILLLGGDYVDTNGGFNHFTRLLYAISDRKNVFAVAGNHDYFYRIEIIRKSMLDNNVSWIEKSSVSFMLNDKVIQIDGNIITSSEIKLNDFKILCLHKPINIKVIGGNYNVAFAGHLHGSQFVFWENIKGLYPGRLLYRWNTLKEKIGKCHYYISRGLGDTLPIRYNCSREMVLVWVGSKEYHAEI